MTTFPAGVLFSKYGPLLLLPFSMNMAVPVLIIVAAETPDTLPSWLLQRPWTSMSSSTLPKPVMARKDAMAFACAANANHFYDIIDKLYFTKKFTLRRSAQRSHYAKNA